MKSQSFFALPLSLAQGGRAMLALVMALALGACGGGGSVPAPNPNPSTGTPSARNELRPLPAEYSARKAVSYSPFRSGNRDTEVITAAMIKQDMDLLVAAGFGLIRLFDSSDKVARLTLEVITSNALNIKVQLGAYIQTESSPYVSAAVKANNKLVNEAEIARAIVLARDFRSTVLAVSVGNETLVSWSFVPSSPQIMADYLARVRSQITQPVTTDDNWAYFGDADVRVISAIDFASMHSYAELDTVFVPGGLWNWRQKSVSPQNRAAAMMDAAIAETRRQYEVVRGFLDARNLTAMPIVIGETGWNAVDVGRLQFRAHPVNQKMYLDRLLAWQTQARRTGNGPAAIFYFEAFDEPWKGSDDKWGLFNVQRQARLAIQTLNPPSASWVYEPGSYTDADAVHWIEPVVSAAINTTIYRTYTLYADAAATATELRPAAGSLSWNAWEGTAIGNPFFQSAPAGDAPNSFEVSPNPYGGWGWGMFLGTPAAGAANLSGFAANGHLRFSIKTNYPGKIEVGFLSNTADNEAAESYLAIAPGEHGYMNDGQWREVAIPLATLLKGNKGDLSMLMHRFVIADRFAITGKPGGTNGLPKLYLDRIRYTVE